MKKADNKTRWCANCHKVIDKTKLYGILTEVVPLCFELEGKEQHENWYLCAEHYLEVAYIKN